jgi:Na+/H+ antiporter NhaD/arsenite permease-like protein
MTKTIKGAGILTFFFLLALVLLYLFVPHGGGDVEKEIGENLSPFTIIPFVLILLGIAIIPLAAPHMWESNRNKGIFAAICGIPILAYFIFAVPDGAHALLSLSHEYFSFIMLLAALFTISGGIFLEGDLKATPRTNTIFLAIGAVIASFIGTTGAAMLLIRPVLRTNSERKHTTHTFIFLIFIVANIGGLLTPLGDPPLFLGFLRGVPFSWTFNLWMEWIVANAILLTIYYIWDSVAYKKETVSDIRRDSIEVQPLRIRGLANFILLGGVIASIVLLKGEHLQWFREPAMFTLALISYLMDKKQEAKRPTPAYKSPRERNQFTFHAIIEVGVLFAGIFVTMLPALCLLKAHGSEFGVTEPWQFFWMTGVLSSFLDNAPTYMTYFSLGQGLDLCGSMECVAGVPVEILKAISCGAVFMGANTYIGNAPNFMVKSIVDEAGVKMPSFGGYMLYSFGILVPIFILLTFIFFV